jgi:5-(carboxyamino)imidazole ribonucleotide synthase
VVGLLMVEVFVAGGEVLVNEIIARPHHASLHADTAFRTSHLENHVRAVLDLPLGDTGFVGDTVVTVNVVGNAAGNDPRDHLSDGLAVDATATIELFGEPHRFDRVLGHVTVIAPDEAEARRRAWQTVIALRGDLTPIRPIVGGRRDSSP